jgi:hypothetical protein
MTATCNICGSAALTFGQALVLGKHAVRYDQCGACGFVQTEEPYWLAEAYKEAVSALDVGAVSRNLRLAPITQSVINRLFRPEARFVDYGGGAGLFVRLMRDAGYDFRWLDKYATNVFARGFEATQGRYDLLTAFEVFEHLVRPVEELQRMLEYSRNVFFTTVLLPAETPRPGRWWYYGLEHGQHVSLYSLHSLEALADRFGLHLCSDGEMHLLTEKTIAPAQFRRILHRRAGRWNMRRKARPSLVDQDYQTLVEQQNKASG